MFQVLSKKDLNQESVMMEIEAPLIAKKAKPGQFIIFRVHENSERIPLTIAGVDPERGAVKIIFQKVGKGTIELGQKQPGESIQDFVGPLGHPSPLDGYQGKRVAVLGGGLGVAIAYPQAIYLHKTGALVDLMVGFRNTDVIILKDDLEAASDRFYLITDDGSSGKKGFVTNLLAERLEAGDHYDLVIAIGPMGMMKAVCDLTAKYNVPTMVSMNTIMVDGTGMCGSCRVTVGGKVKFACVDGPDFDGHQIDFDEAMKRSRAYRPKELSDKDHYCKLLAEADQAQGQSASK